MALRIRFSKLSLLAIIVSAVSFQALADKMDLDTHTAVISRLTTIIQGLDDTDPSKVPSALRVADLLAERSRLKGLKEVEQNCQNCLKASEDRRMALYYYGFAIPRLDDATRSQAMLQKAHLHYSLGEMSETEKQFVTIIKEGSRRHSGFILGQAHASLGDVYFQKAEFKKSMEQYKKALAINETPQRGMVHYRLGWCLFNLDQTAQAVAMFEMILQTPKMTEIKSTEGVSQDESFKIDVSKDLASFYARTQVNRQKITKLMNLSPVDKRTENLFYLATEADRLGKKKEAALAWMVYLETSPSDKNTLEAQIRLMKVKRDMGDGKGANATFAHIAQLWKKPGCDEKCGELQIQIRKFVTDWNREEKKTQTPDLTQAYVMYTNLFPEDAEMFMWGADVAKQRNQPRQAFDLYHRSAAVAHKKLSKGTAEEKAATAKVFEASLIGEIDMAETVKAYDLRMLAYNHYLELNPNGSKNFEVRYQIAQTEFEKPDYEKSSSLFRKLALEKNAQSKTLQKSAASMSIEGLTRLKRTDLIEPWSYEYAQVFPQARNEFLLIHRKTVLNGVAMKINLKTADAADMKRLDSVSLVGGTAQDRISLNKSRYLLAIRLENFTEAKKANQNLLETKELAAADRADALQSRIWLAELELDFRTAYFLTRDQSGKMNAERALKLVWLANMAGLPQDKHENDFLAMSKDRSLRNTVIARRIQRQRQPEKELKKHIKELSQSPEVLARLSLEIYGRNRNQKVLEQAFEFKAVRRSPTGSVIGRMLEYPSLNQEISKLMNARLDSKTDKGLKKSLENRIKLMSDVEKSGQRAIANRDIVLQAVILDVLSRENERLHMDILHLPLPNGLTAEQKMQYQQLLAGQAAPFKNKASQIETKRSQLWSDKSWIQALSSNYVQARNEFKPALRQDLQKLMAHAPESARGLLEDALNESNKLPSENAIANARMHVRKSPFEQDYVLELKDLESRRGNDIAVAHLEARLHQMKGVVR